MSKLFTKALVDIGSLYRRPDINLWDSSTTSLPPIGFTLIADGVSLSIGDRVLFTNLSDSILNNKIYKVIKDFTTGLSLLTMIVTKDSRTSNGSAILGDFVFVLQGTNASKAVTFDGQNWSSSDVPNTADIVSMEISALTGDVSTSGTGVAIATVNSVGGSTSANLHTAELATNSATSTNTINKIIKRDSSGNFSAGTITANLTGLASSATNFVGSLSGDVTGAQNSTVVAAIGGSSASAVHAAELLVSASTSANTSDTLVKRDSSGNLSAGIITANLIGNVTGSVSSFSGSLIGDVTGTQGATIVSTIANSSAANVHTAELLANAATASNTASTIVKRDSNGSFNANVIGLASVSLSDFPTGGSIGLAMATVDLASVILVNQTTLGQLLTLPSPTNTSIIRKLTIINVGLQTFTLLGQVVALATEFIWTGSTWMYVI